MALGQVNALESYNVNVYVSYAAPGVPIIEPGITPSGQFIDTVIGVDWLRLQIQANVYNLLVGAATKMIGSSPAFLRGNPSVGPICLKKRHFY